MTSERMEVMAEHDEMLSEFCRVTDADPEEARIFLEGSGWNYNLAVSNYFEETDDEPVCSSDEVMEDKEQSSPPAPPKVSSPYSSSRIVTMSSLIENEDKSSEEGQAFYAGGSTRSGQQVLGPGSEKYRGRHIVAEMFKAAKSIGAEVVGPTENQCSSAHLKAFRGTGYVLDSSSATNETDNLETSDNNQCLTMCLRAWRTGFTVENGPLREYTDPKNKEFLDTVRKGEIPRELVPKSKKGEISLRIEDHSNEDYVPPKPLLCAFYGQGHRLGSPTPIVVCANTESKDDSQKREEEARRNLNVNQSQPVTVVQIRLADGSRLMVQLNHNHTVGNIRQFLVVARPEYSATVFSLWRSYPSTELTDDAATISEADLLNSVIVQKL